MPLRTPLLLLPILLVGWLPPAQAKDGAGGSQVAPLLARLTVNPLDAEALLSLADAYEAQGKTGYARRYLRAFLRLIPTHPKRVVVARRVARLLPKSPWIQAEDNREEGGFVIYRNLLDGSRGVHIPAGVYVRRLAPDHPSDPKATLDVRFDVHVDSFVMDLYETPRASWIWFALESGWLVPKYWGADAAEYRKEQREDAYTTWTWIEGTFQKPGHPAWPLSWFEARALARAAGKRLPTEAQWEKAARGGRHLDGDDEGTRPNPMPLRRFPWGEAPAEGAGTVRVNAGADGVAGGDGDRSIRVDALPDGASPYGCLNMLGNVQEWCEDWFVDDNHVLQLPLRNPLATGRGFYKNSKVIRGGYFNWSAHEVSIDQRQLHTYDSDGMALLFKCALRGASDAPFLDDDIEEPEDPRQDTPRNDPLDGSRYLGVARSFDNEHAAKSIDRMAAWIHARAAARLIRSGPARERALDLVQSLRPTDVWEPLDDGRFRNRIDGGIAVVDGDLLVDIHETTEGQYLQFVAETDRDGTRGVCINAMRYGRGDLPAVVFDPSDAVAYATWAGKRLPTRAQWRRVARMDSQTWPWGEGALHDHAAFEDARELLLGDVNDLRLPVGSFPQGANPVRVQDLVGSLPEWCLDGPLDYPEGHWLVGGGLDQWEISDRSEFVGTLENAYPDRATYPHITGMRCVAPVPGTKPIK